MKTLLFPVGTHGDVNPFVGIALELKRRGHQPAIVTNRSFGEMVRSQGVDFLGLESFQDVGAFLKNPDVWNPRTGWRLAGRWGTLEPMRETYRVIADHYVPGQTVVVAAYSSFGARIANERLGVPLATVVLEPDKLRSEFKTSIMPRPMLLADWVPRSLKRAQFYVLDRWFIDRFVGAETNAFRAELGLPPARDFLRSWCLSPDCVLAMFPDWFAPPQPDWPCNLSVTGFPLWDPDFSDAAVQELRRFCDDGTPPIVFTPGSGMQTGKQFFRTAIECCQALNRRGVLLTRFSEHVPAKLPQGVVRMGFVPLPILLRRAAAFVYHGGIGSMGHALAAGVPQLIMPMAFNQPDDAARLKRLGVAEVVSPRAFRTPRVVRALRALLDSSSVADRCREISRKMTATEPLAAACDAIESLAGSDLSRTPKADRRDTRRLVSR
ncbi:MAG: glycosyltransferase [Planctomycetes bacterium]|nr:glycosyltransferase [Planctomycetota bacterium]